ncbi:MAG: xanthine dehydrogenase small subunit [Trueperaceae bacterium]|nr:xanthine dehydrogenase small subunit [Trueperaceae bacterium]
MTNLTFTLNGRSHQVGDVAPATPLLDYLRQRRLIGTKQGCSEGDCGACTVALVGRGPDGAAHYQAVNSCLVPVAAVAGREVVTVEGLSKERDALHPVQQALADAGGSQCGYCTPGFVMSMFAAHYDSADGTVDDLAFEGNLCRCTGYLPIRRAARGLEPPSPTDPFNERLHQTDTSPDPTPLSHHAHGQHFVRPTSLADVFTALATDPDAKLIAGGTDLVLDMTHGRAKPNTLISLEAVAELQTLEVTPSEVTVGAGVPLSHLKSELHGVFPTLDTMLRWFASTQIRNRATVGGNLATASPIGDLPPVLLSLGAELDLVSSSGERTVPLNGFFHGYRQTALEPHELIRSVRIPRTPTVAGARQLSQAYKVGKRGTDDISTVAASFYLELDAQNVIAAARLGYGGVAATPVRATVAEEMLLGRTWDETTVSDAKTLLAESFMPLSDLRGSAAYRTQLIANLFEKFFVDTHTPPKEVAA